MLPIIFLLLRISPQHVWANEAGLDDDEGHCVWYDACGWDPDYAGNDPSKIHYLNCHYTGPAKPATEEMLELLAETCPHLYEGGQPQALCCSKRQLMDLKTNFVTPQQIIEPICPTCYYNFKKNFCDLTCRPDHSKFVRVDHTIEGPGYDEGDGDYTGQNVTMVKDVTYFVTEEFNTKTYESCVNVQFPGLGTIMDMLCGGWGSALCSPQRWWSYLGSVDNGYSPFQIDYAYGPDNVTHSEDGFEFHNAEVLSCRDIAPGYEAGCSCTDCPDSCKMEPPVFRNTSSVGDWEIAGMNGVGFIMIFVFAGLSSTFLLTSCCCNLSISSNCRLNININSVIEKFFTMWGKLVASHPLIVIILTVGAALGISAGALKLEITTDPVELWAAPTSRSRIEKDFFDSEFRPFYRTSLVIIKAIESQEHGMVDIDYYDPYLDMDLVFSQMFQKKFLFKALELQKKIENITFEFEETDDNGNRVIEEYDINKICNKPLDPFNSHCNINSIWAYWKDVEANLDKTDEVTIGTGEDEQNYTIGYLDHFLDCSRNPSQNKQQDTKHSIGCDPKWGGVVNPYYVLGGFIPEDTSFPEEPQYQNSEAIVLQIIIDNYDTKSTDKKDIDGLKRAMAWELEFVNFMKNWIEEEMPEYMDVAFTSERSVEDELDRETYGDLATIAVSYIIMFAYITLALGQYSSISLTGFLIESKITLGLFGVMIVLLSVFASMGIFALIGVPATLIIFEIIPFLVLAVGVDNIFILVQTYQRDVRGKAETVEDQIARVVGEVAPSMLQSSITEAACFFLGALSGMPAVKSFALYAGMALLIDFILQITAFIALMTLDIKRQEKRKFDILCCLGSSSKKPSKEHVPVLYKVFEVFYAPFLLSSYVRPAVMILFLGFTCLSISVVPKVEIGLDQELSMPDDSFVLKFFEWMKLYLSVGPPVYLVVNNTAGALDLSTIRDQNLLCSGVEGCREDSVAGQVNQWRQYPDQSYIATAAFSWVDDYISWVKTDTDEDHNCCRFYENTTQFCDATLEEEPKCKQCFNDGDRPQNSTLFQQTIHHFLQQNPGEHCPKAGHGAFADAVNHEIIDVNSPLGENSYLYDVKSSNMMAFHTILRTSVDYYSALAKARELTDSITASININRTAEEQVTVFPYSVFYVFYEQYLTMWEDTLTSLGISLGAIFVVTFLLMGLDLTSAIIVLFTVLLILVNLGAFMYWWNITLNAVSLTNLVMAVGISVEFSAHIMRYFAKFAREDRVENARKAVINMGSSVLSGITLTKFGGIIVLGFAHSKIFTIFFFR